MTDSNQGGQVPIVIVDDEPSIVASLKRELRNFPFDIHDFTDPRAALAAINRIPVAMVISDNQMPGMTGIELLEHVKNIAPDASRMILTGFTDLESAVRAINDGEVNYFVTKPWDSAQLRERVSQGVERFRRRQQLARSTEEIETRNKLLALTNLELKDLATRDGLTRLFNRAEFDAALERQLKIYRRDSQVFSLALGDIDNFKQVNDVHGYPAGDNALRMVANVLLTSLRDEVDTSYRYGGEEFAVIMRATQESGAVRVMNRVLETIRNTPIQVPSGTIYISTSIGVAAARPDTTAVDLLSEADRALYQAKHSGKNRVIAVSSLFD